MTANAHNQPTSPANDGRLLAAKDAAMELGICVSLFWRLNKAGDLPAAIYVTAKTPRWRKSELHAAMETRRVIGGRKTLRGADQ